VAYPDPQDSLAAVIQRRGSAVTSLYPYIGPNAIREHAAGKPAGLRVESLQDLERWLRATAQEPNREGLIAVTFVVDRQGNLRVADRGSEHIACSGGEPVLSAGELFLRTTRAGVEVVEVSNQSTGFCPEPESWPAVAAALDRLGIPHPGDFTLSLTFRRCTKCGERNVVKDDWFVCGVCGAELPRTWNFG
jgi:hypothetical protein